MRKGIVLFLLLVYSPPVFAEDLVKIEEQCIFRKGDESPCSKNTKLFHDLHCLPRSVVDGINAEDTAQDKAVLNLGKCEAKLNKCQADRSEQSSRALWFSIGLAAGLIFGGTLFLVAK